MVVGAGFAPFQMDEAHFRNCELDIVSQEFPQNRKTNSGFLKLAR